MALTLMIADPLPPSLLKDKPRMDRIGFISRSVFEDVVKDMVVRCGSRVRL